MNTRDFWLVGGLTIVGGVLWTLLPDSHSLAVLWPNVLLWQAVAFLPILWLIGQLWYKPLAEFRFGYGLDWIFLGLFLVLGISTIASSFRSQSVWYSLAAFGFLASLYAFQGGLNAVDRQRKILNLQGGLGIIFSIESLVLWFTRTYLPEYDRLAKFNTQYHTHFSFDFKNLDLQNYQPLGHQNYVAGYLVLTLPLLIGLLLQSSGWKRWLWGTGILIQLIDLYTTSSRGGWLAIVVALGVFILPILRFNSRRITVPIILGTVWLILGGIVSNDRLRSFLISILQGDLENSQITYRLVTNAIGWKMGLSHLWTGLGLGSVPLVYQAYHPHWAGEEAELHYQLHSTLAQLWAELGLGSILVIISLIVVIGIKIWGWFHHLSSNQNQSILTTSLLASLVGYGVMSLTDYQLDNVCITGTLSLVFVLFWRSISSLLTPPPSQAPHLSLSQDCDRTQNDRKLKDKQNDRKGFTLNQGLSLGVLGFSCTLWLWLFPIERSWAVAQTGFDALAAEKIDTFIQNMTIAHHLAPQDPYYPLQVAWNLGELSQHSKDPAQQVEYRKQAIQWFQTAMEIAPDQEFTSSNQAWLLLQTGEPKNAETAFKNSLRLLPAKQGVWFGLGVSYLLQNNPQAAIDSFTQELLRHPLEILSPFWTLAPFNVAKDLVFDRLDQRCSQALSNTTLDPQLLNYFHQIRGGLRWWRGDFSQAESDWKSIENTIGLALLDLDKNLPPSLHQAAPQSAGETTAKTAAENLFMLWQTADPQWLSQAWQAFAQTTGSVPRLSQSLLLQTLQAAKAQHHTFLDWIKTPQFYRSYRKERLGFGVLNRHLGGSVPKDYTLLFDHLLVTDFFPDLFPDRSFFPALDQFLEKEFSQDSSTIG